MDTDEAYVSIVIWPRVSGYFRSGIFWIHHLTIKFGKTIWESVHDTAQGWFGWQKKHFSSLFNAISVSVSKYAPVHYGNTKVTLDMCHAKFGRQTDQNTLTNYLKITTKYRLLLWRSTEKAVLLETVKYWNTLY